jgi:ABC-type multidrug transport system ATPase subunit
MFESNVDIVASFRDIGISSINPTKQIISNVSGYVIRGGITAIVGPTASGKSLLMGALSGRVHNLQISGDFFIDGRKVDCRNISNPISYVSQEDILIGHLTARETLYNSAAMKRDKAVKDIIEDVEQLLQILGLTDVADNYIGATFRGGLSRCQKRRVEIGAELVAAPLVLFLDEPTSGLDTNVAFEVLKSIQDIARASNGRLSIMLSIHQPNLRTLRLFDHIMVLGGGTMNFFGSMTESIQYLTSIGFPLPRHYIPTDFLLLVSDPNFADESKINFAGTVNFMQHLIFLFFEVFICIDLYFFISRDDSSD